MITRRHWITRAALLGGGAALANRLGAQPAPPIAATEPGHDHGAMAPPSAPAEVDHADMEHGMDHEGMQHEGGQHETVSPAQPSTDELERAALQRSARRLGYMPVVTPNGATLPWRLRGGVKEFHLVAEPVEREFAPGMRVLCWGYNGSVPGPTIEAVEGDRVRILVTNRLPEHTSVHWHGVFLPNGMDGVAGLLQPHIRPGETYAYEFTLHQHGTYMYHPHADEALQMALGMAGFFVIHPRASRAAGSPPIDRDFCILPHMWAIEPGTMRPNPAVMLDFNLFTFNGRAYPGTAPLVVRRGDRVRLRFANVSMDSHPIHIHGHRFWTVETDGGEIPAAARWPESTIDVGTGQTRAVEFVADVPGDWPLHCHKTHHAMNAMGHDIPNVLGTDTAAARRIGELVPGFMAMGTKGMAEHAQHGAHMPGLENTLPMMAGTGPFGGIEMGGMFTIIKIREGLSSYADPGWYAHPPGTVAQPVALDASAWFTCPRHPALLEPQAGECPACGSDLVARPA